jgi:type IV secretory pathway component VirB8
MARVTVTYKFPPNTPNPANADKVGRYPAHVHVPALESRRYLWTSRAYAIALYISLSFSVVLASMLFMLVSMKSTSPMLVHFPSHREWATSMIEPHLVRRSGLDVLAEKMIGEYVKIREEITPENPALMDRYVQFIAARSSDEQFAFFQNQRPAMMESYRIRRFYRQVDVDRVGRIGNSFLVDYKTTDFDLTGREVQKLGWQAIIAAQWQAQVTAAQAAKETNPLGFGVSAYEARVVKIYSGQKN